MRASRAITRAEITQVIGRFVNQQLTAITARVAREKLAEVQGSAPAPYVQFVDGREGAALESVKPGGNIIFRFNRLSHVLDWIYEQLVQHSPIGPDSPPHLHYFEDHELWIDGARVSAAVGEVIDVPPGGTAMFINLRAYARKIENGLSSQAPSGVYQITAIAAQRRFPAASITFDYQSYPAEVFTTGRSAQHHVRRSNSAHPGSYRYPTITVRARN